MSKLPTTNRTRLTVLSAAVALIGGGMAAANLAGAASGPSAVDYAQCQNGAPGTSPSPDCSWINGILNASGSQYHEDQVTAQRLLVAFPDTVGGSHAHSVTLRYLDRKSGIHAYDYLAAADATMTDALDLRCDGLAVSICPTTPTDSTQSTPDGDHLGPVSGVYSDLISSHMSGLTAAQKTIRIYGATFSDGVGSNPPAMSDPSHDCLSPCTGDDYATVKFSFVTPAGAGTHYVQLMFGGHLAAGSQLDGWGTGLGASSVNGGPYHIKWDAADNSSVGNRDNQIMSNAIIPIIAQGTGIVTTPSPSSPATIDTIGNVSDSAEVTVASALHPPTGSVKFDLYGPFSTQPTQPAPGGSVACVDPPTAGENQITELTDTTYATTSDPLKFTFSSGNYNLGADSTNLAVGWYQWVAHYVPGADQYNLSFDGNCFTTGEQLHVTQASASGTSTQSITDTVTVSGFGTLSGTVTFEAYTENTCTDTTKRVLNDTNNALDSNNKATSDAINANTATGTVTYYWKVTYNGDTNNASGVIEACQVQTAAIQNHS